MSNRSRARRFFREWRGPLRNTLLSVGVAIVGTLMAGEVEWFYTAATSGRPEDAMLHQNALRLMLWLICLSGLLAYAFRIINRQNTAHTDARSITDVDSRPCLITGFSKFRSNGRPRTEREDLPEQGGKYDYTRFTTETATGNDTNANLVFGNWQQTLRVIDKLSDQTGERHGKPRRLERVIFIPGNQGEDQADPLLEILNRLFAGRGIEFSILADPSAPDRPYAQGDDIYEDTEAMQEAFLQAHNTLARDRSTSRQAVEKQTYIDITPGQKPFSVAAATYTFNRDLRIIYNPSGKEHRGLYSYDTRIDFETFSGG